MWRLSRRAQQHPTPARGTPSSWRAGPAPSPASSWAPNRPGSANGPAVGPSRLAGGWIVG